MPRRFNRKVNRRRRRKAKWRQQKLAVGTVKKIAKQEAKKAVMNDKRTEDVYYEIRYGNFKLTDIDQITQPTDAQTSRQLNGMYIPGASHGLGLPLIRCGNTTNKLEKNSTCFPHFLDYITKFYNEGIEPIGSKFYLSKIKIKIKVMSPPKKYYPSVGTTDERGRIPQIRYRMMVVKTKCFDLEETTLNQPLVNSIGSGSTPYPLFYEVMSRVTESNKMQYTVLYDKYFTLSGKTGLDPRKVKWHSWETKKGFICDFQIDKYEPTKNQLYLWLQCDSEEKKYYPSVSVESRIFIKDV